MKVNRAEAVGGGGWVPTGPASAVKPSLAEFLINNPPKGSGQPSCFVCTGGANGTPLPERAELDNAIRTRKAPISHLVRWLKRCGYPASQAKLYRHRDKCLPGTA
jgi:hypothetical protein